MRKMHRISKEKRCIFNNHRIGHEHHQNKCRLELYRPSNMISMTLGMECRPDYL